MCGLLGFSSANNLNEDKIKTLMLFNQARGKDSLGYYVPNKEISCYQISITSDIRDTYPSWSIFSYRASDRTMAYNTSTLYDNRATTAQYASANTTMKNILYYKIDNREKDNGAGSP